MNRLPLNEEFNDKKGEIIRRLIDLRNEVADKVGQERYKILQVKTIDHIAETMPQTLIELSAIKGIGPKKLKELGPAILSITKGETLPEKEESVQISEIGDAILSVSEFLNQINDILYTKNVLVQGEISGLSLHPTGVYMTLKDKKDESILDCYIKPYVYSSLGVELEDGMEVKIGGFPSVYKPRGRFRFTVQTLELTGEGSLKKAYDLLKKKLELEGLFARKRELPEFIKRIGVITSKQGAVMGDFRNNLEPLGYEIFMKDVRVEGVRAVEEITEALHWFNENADELDLDVLVLIRGGGSLEDLQAFNNEVVVRAVFASKVPTICAIGHHKDVPIVSLVGDDMPSTPTGAAIRINQSWDSLKQNLPMFERELLSLYENALSSVYTKTFTLREKMVKYLERAFIKFEDLRSRLFRVYSDEVQSVILKVETIEKYLLGVSPERSLKLGYSIVVDSFGKVIKDSSGVKIGEDIKTRLYKGEIISKVKSIK